MGPLGQAEALVGPVAGALDGLVGRCNGVGELQCQLRAVAHVVNMLIVNILNRYQLRNTRAVQQVSDQSTFDSRLQRTHFMVSGLPPKSCRSWHWGHTA